MFKNNISIVRNFFCLAVDCPGLCGNSQRILFTDFHLFCKKRKKTGEYYQNRNNTFHFFFFSLKASGSDILVLTFFRVIFSSIRSDSIPTPSIVLSPFTTFTYSFV